VKILATEQRCDEWRLARLGRMTSSRAADAFRNPRKGATESTTRRNYIVQLALERLTGRSQERHFQTEAMREGSEREVDAQAAYEALTGRLLDTTGFVAHDDLMAGCSPDGYLDDFAGIVEIKSPIPATHLDYLRTSVIPPDYMRQIQHALWITGAQWCDWLSYQPAMPDALQIKLVRVWAKDIDLKAYELLARMFLAEVEQEVKSVEALEGALVAF